MKIGNHEFEGPLDNLEDLEEAPGLCAVVNVRDSGARLLAGVAYSANVRESAKRLVTDPSWQERTGAGQLKYGVRYTGAHLELDIKQVMIDLKSQYHVTCIF